MPPRESPYPKKDLQRYDKNILLRLIDKNCGMT